MRVRSISNFKRSQNPHDALGIGLLVFKEGDKIQMLTDEEYWEKGDILTFSEEDHVSYETFNLKH